MAAKVIKISVRSNKGNVRENNEDNFIAGDLTLPPDLNNRDFSVSAVIPATAVLAVCDGIGGEAMGKEASEAAVKRLSDMSDEILGAHAENLASIVKAYVCSADSIISSFEKRAGTTLALAVIKNDCIRCFNIGDSRIYCLKRERLVRITNDHTAAASIANRNAIDPAQARMINGGNKLTRCIGIGNNNNVEEYPKIRGKCRLLICSDGLTDMLFDDEIEKILAYYKNIEAASDRLMRDALRRGGRDNITFIIADTPSRGIADTFRRWRLNL